MSEQGNWNDAKPEQAAEQTEQNIPWGRQVFKHRAIAFYGAIALALVSFAAFMLVVIGCIGQSLSPNAQFLAMTVWGVIPAIVVLALLRHTQPKTATKETPDMGLLVALAKEIAKLFGKG